MFETKRSVSNINKSDNYNNKNDRYIENEVFTTTFLLLKAAGIWLPTSMKNRLPYIFYQMYSAFCFTSSLAFLVNVAIGTITSSNVSLLETWYALLIFSHGFLKFTNLLWRRLKIIHILKNKIMDPRWNKSCDSDEYDIIMKSERSEKFATKVWFSLISINFASGVVSPIIYSNSNHSLFDAYSLCDMSIRTCFWTSYTYQCFGYMITSTAHVCCDCLIFNLIERINTHIKILIYRLEKFPSRVIEQLNKGIDTSTYESLLLKEYIQDHHRINKSVEEVNNTFSAMVTWQIITTISIVCTNIYFLSKQELFSSEFLPVFAFLFCVLVQNYLYCWYAFKLSESSSYVGTAIFNLNWTVLGKKSKSTLLIIMMSTSHEIKIFNNFLVNLSPEAFLKLIKLSYSAFNLLRSN